MAFFLLSSNIEVEQKGQKQTTVLKFVQLIKDMLCVRGLLLIRVLANYMFWKVNLINFLADIKFAKLFELSSEVGKIRG